MNTSDDNQEIDKFFENRPHHYYFAHRAVRQACAADPVLFFKCMGSDFQKSWTEMTWNTMEELMEQKCEDLFSEDVDVETFRIGDCPTILFIMPEPIAVPEVFFVAVVLDHFPEEGENPEEVDFRYFTLEFGYEPLMGGQHAVFCEWDGETHLNFGPGPQPEIPLFIEAVREKIKT